MLGSTSGPPRSPRPDGSGDRSGSDTDSAATCGADARAASTVGGTAIPATAAAISPSHRRDG